MNQEQALELVIKLETRTRQLIDRQGMLRKEMDLLRQQLNEQSESIQKLEQEKKGLQDQYARLKMAKYFDRLDDDQRNMKLRINAMIRSVDKCLAMLKVD